MLELLGTVFYEIIQMNGRRAGMWKYIKKYKWRNLAVAGLIFVSSSISMVITLMYMLIGRAILDQDMRKLFLAVGVSLILLLVGNLVVDNVLKLVKSRTIALMNQDMRADLNRKFMRRSYEEFCRIDSGEYLSEYTNVIREAEEQGFANFYKGIELTIDLVLGVLVLGIINIWLLFLSIVISSIVTVLFYTMQKKIRSGSEKVAQAQNVFTDQVKEQVAGFRVLKYFGHSEQFCEELDESQRKLEAERVNFQKAQSRITQLIYTATQILNVTLQLGVFGMAAFRIIPVETIFSGISLMGNIQGGISGLTQMRVLYAGAKPYFEKLEETGEEKKELPSLPEIKTEISAKNLTFSYGNTPVFADMNVKFQIGEKYAVVGKSGSGKTTFLKIVLGQLRGYEGEMLFDGVDAKAYSEDSFYSQMAYIDQNVFLMDTSIRENITLGDPFTEEEIKAVLEKSALTEELKRFENGLDTVVGENGKNLSGGQKQRIAIARALIHDRNILVVDEGTSALDRENAEVIESSLLKQKGLTLILVSHHLTPEREKEYTKVWKMEACGVRDCLCGNI